MIDVRFQLHHLLSAAAARHGSSPALTAGSDTVTYSELWQLTAGAAAGIQGLGLVRRDRVAVYLDKRIETVATVFGASAAGGVVVPVNPVLRTRQVNHILADCSARILITSAERWDSLRNELPGTTTVEHVVLVGPASPPAATTRHHMHRWHGLDDLYGGLPPVDASGTESDMAAVFYTSGSTGGPKGVVVSHRNLLVGAESVAMYLENSAEDVILAVLPLSFDAGFSQLTTGFQVGAHVVLINYLLPGEVVRQCARHRVTGLTGVPPLWIQLADQQWPALATQSMRYFASTGGRMPKGTLDRLREIFPAAKPYLMYGLTEAFRSTYLDPSQVDKRPDSIGRAIPNAEVLVVRPDGTEAEPGEEGELVHRGPLVSMGYWNDPIRTAERFRPAPARQESLGNTELAVWSGDTVTRDEEGYLYFVGRTDDMIKTSGYRVSPTELEEAAYRCGQVRDAVALGLEDPGLGQRIVLVVAPSSDAAIDPGSLLRELKHELPFYMIPRQIVVRSELPRSPNGKFDRSRIRRELVGDTAI